MLSSISKSWDHVKQRGLWYGYIARNCPRQTFQDFKTKKVSTWVKWWLQLHTYSSSARQPDVTESCSSYYIEGSGFVNVVYIIYRSRSLRSTYKMKVKRRKRCILYFLYNSISVTEVFSLAIISESAAQSRCFCPVYFSRLHYAYVASPITIHIWHGNITCGDITWWFLPGAGCVMSAPKIVLAK